MAQVLLRSARHRALALIVGLGLLGGAALGILQGLEQARARTATERARLERALRWANDDASLHHRLGRWEQLSLVDGEPERALRHFRRATELNPYESEYWLDLADALWLGGDPAGGEAAVERALQVDPRTPRTLWRAGNFWLRQGEPARAFPYFRQVLLTDWPLTPLVIQVSHRTLRDPDVVLRDLLPPEPKFLLAYLRQLLQGGESESAAAARVWEALVVLGEPFEAQEVLFYVDFLIRTRQLPQAVKVWRDLKSLRLLPLEALSRDDWLYNPGLFAPILNGGFGWRAQPVPGAHVTLGAGPRGRQSPAVILRFLGEENLHYRNFFQYVVVEPNRRYRFRAWLSTEGITTESGPRLEIADVYDPRGRAVRSPGLVGTNDWVREELEFLTGARTRLVRVGIVRLPSRRLSNKIRGTVRAADFSLREVVPGS